MTSTPSLFKPFKSGLLETKNRIVMAPMTRCFSPEGVPNEKVTEYYRLRAAGGTGLIITEGTWIPHDSASNEENAPRFYGEDALSGWNKVVEAVHAEGGKIVPQLWHVGLTKKPDIDELYKEATHYSNKLSPSGYLEPNNKIAEPMTLNDIDTLIQAYTEAAVSAKKLGFDGVELHGAHGYLFDQFFWSELNKRNDVYGGDQVQRTRFAADVVRSIKSATGSDFPLIFRFSQWKLHDFDARMFHTPQQLDDFLAPLVDAGVDIFHCSQRRFWEAEFTGSPLNLAGWTKKLSGKPTISVGSVSLNQDFLSNMFDHSISTFFSLDKLVEMMDREDFDLIAVGRALIANPDWGNLVQQKKYDELTPYSAELLTQLV